MFVFIIIDLIINQIEKLMFLQIDNEIDYFENNNDFSEYQSDIKAIALYLPQFHKIKENDEWWGKGFTEWVNVKKAKPLYKGHYQPRKPGDPKDYLEYYELTTVEVLKKQIKLAKSHGIYGFGIYYYWFSGKILLDKPLNILLNNRDIDFLFLLIWANENWTKRWDGKEQDILIQQDYLESDPEKFIKDIKKYLIDQRYIKINDKPIIGVYEPRKIPNLIKTISIWREKSMEYGIGEIYIIVTLNEGSVEEFHNLHLFNAAYQFPPRGAMISSNYLRLKSNFFKNNFFLYTAFLYNELNISDTILKDFHFYKGTMLGFDNSPRKAREYVIFQNYSPEQFYLINKKIVEWTQKKYNKNNRFIFINAWNEWGEGTYLEPDNKYGYASINALSKAIFHLPFNGCNYNLEKLRNGTKIAVQVHIFYENLINEIINKTNNIPVNFDLYLSTDSLIKAIHIEEIIQKHSLANNYEIKIYENKGRDVLPFLLQIRKHIKKYKYICHLHTKKTSFVSFGDEWRQYLFNNLLGNKEIISEILTDLENNEKLGFIFPESFHKVIIEYETEVTEKDKFFISYLLKKINKSLRIGEQIEFPVGNMFWAKGESIHQIFNIDITNEIPTENNQVDGTILHGIERIWLYLVKLNGYSYKKIFKHF